MNSFGKRLASLLAVVAAIVMAAVGGHVARADHCTPAIGDCTECGGLTGCPTPGAVNTSWQYTANPPYVPVCKMTAWWNRLDCLDNDGDTCWFCVNITVYDVTSDPPSYVTAYYGDFPLDCGTSCGSIVSPNAMSPLVFMGLDAHEYMFSWTLCACPEGEFECTSSIDEGVSYDWPFHIHP